MTSCQQHESAHLPLPETSDIYWVGDLFVLLLLLAHGCQWLRLWRQLMHR